MHEHMPHLIQTVIARQSAGLALTLAAMRAQLTARPLDLPSVADLADRCRRLFAALGDQRQASLALALDEASALTIELRTDGSQRRYDLRFIPPAAFAERWQELYPRQLTIERWPGDEAPDGGGWRS